MAEDEWKESYRETASATFLDTRQTSTVVSCKVRKGQLEGANNFHVSGTFKELSCCLAGCCECFVGFFA